MNVNHLIPYYLMASYLYYELDESVISDDVFNTICKLLLANFNTLNHPHAHLLDIDSLKANTGYTIRYPEITKRAALLWLKSKDTTRLISVLEQL